MKNQVKKQIIPMLDAYKNYFLSVVDLLLKRNVLDVKASRRTVNEMFQQLPDWYYQTRVKIPFQVGRRFFITKLDALGEILFSMHHLARHSFAEDLLEKISAPVLICKDKIEKFMDAIITVLNLEELSQQAEDFSQDIARLEHKFRDAVPYTAELLDVSKDAVYLVEFIFELKELRAVLLKLAETLR